MLSIESTHARSDALAAEGRVKLSATLLGVIVVLTVIIVGPYFTSPHCWGSIPAIGCLLDIQR
jgi:hypothetical protein